MRYSRLLAAIALLVPSAVLAAANAADAPAIDVSCVRPGDFFAIVVRPKRIAESPLLAAVISDPQIVEGIKQLGIDPRTVDQALFLVPAFSEGPSGRVEPMPPVIVANFTHDVSAKDLLPPFLQHMSERAKLKAVEVTIGGKNCLQLDTPDTFVYQPSPRCIVLSGKQGVTQVIEEGPKGPLAKRLQKADAASDLFIAFAPEAFPNLPLLYDEVSHGAPPLLKNYFSAAETVRGGSLAVSLAGPSLLHMTLDTENAEAAGNVKDLLEQSVRMAMAGLVIGKQSMSKDMRARLAPALKLADQCLDGAKAAKAATQVTLDVKRPEVLDKEGAALVAAAFIGLRDSALARRAAARRVNNLRQIALAMQNYASCYNNCFPSAAIEKDGKPLLSWRVTLLPYLEEAPLYHEFHLDEPWGSPHNLEVAKHVPSVYQSAEGGADGKTRMMLFTGKDAAWDGGKEVPLSSITDGTSNTIACIEAGPDKAVFWTKPEDLPFDPKQPLAALGKIPADGFYAALCDGSVHRFKKLDNATLKALVTPSGGEVIDWSKIER